MLLIKSHGGREGVGGGGFDWVDSVLDVHCIGRPELDLSPPPLLEPFLPLFVYPVFYYFLCIRTISIPILIL